MRRYKLVLLALVAVISLGGCAGGPSESGTSTTSSSVAVADNAPAAVSVSQASAPAPKPSPSTYLLTNNLNGQYLNYLKYSNGSFVQAASPISLPPPTYSSYLWTGVVPQQIALAKIGKQTYAYCVNGSNQITAFAAGDSLQQLPSAYTVSGNSALVCAVDPSNKFLYVSTVPITFNIYTIVSDLEVFPINPTTGYLGSGTALASTLTTRIDGLVCGKVGTSEVLITILDYDGGLNFSASVINPTDGSLSSTHSTWVGSSTIAASYNANCNHVALSTFSGHTYAYVALNQSAVAVVPIFSDGSLGSVTQQQVFQVGQTTSLALGTVGTNTNLYAICNYYFIDGGQHSGCSLGAFRVNPANGLLGDGSASPHTIVTSNGANTYSLLPTGGAWNQVLSTYSDPASIAFDPNHKYVLVSTHSPTTNATVGSGDPDLFVFPLNATSGAPNSLPSTGTNDGAPGNTSGAYGPGSLTLFIH